jgi:hypothetical protein
MASALTRVSVYRDLDLGESVLGQRPDRGRSSVGKHPVEQPAWRWQAHFSPAARSGAGSAGSLRLVLPPRLALRRTSLAPAWLSRPRDNSSFCLARERANRRGSRTRAHVVDHV